MKRIDLKPGMQVYYDTHADWDTPAYGQGYGKKATVEAVEPYSDKYPAWSRKFEPYTVAKGTGVLVTVEGASTTTVVTLGQLRGPYDETVARIAEWCKGRDQKAQVQQATERGRRARLDETADKVRAMGASSLTLFSTENGANVKVPLDLFAKMVDALSEQGWTYSR